MPPSMTFRGILLQASASPLQSYPSGVPPGSLELTDCPHVLVMSARNLVPLQKASFPDAAPREREVLDARPGVGKTVTAHASVPREHFPSSSSCIGSSLLMGEKDRESSYTTWRKDHP